MKCFKFIAQILFLFLILLFQPGTATAQQDLVMLTLDNFPPYSWVEDSRARGIDVEIVEELRKRTGLPLLITFVPWKRGMSMLKKGEAAGAFAAFRTPERDSYARYIEPPLHYSIYKVFVRKGEEFPFSSIYDLHGKTIVKNRGFHISESFTQATANKDIDVIEANNMNKGLELLIRGRVDAVVGNVQEVRYFADQLGISQAIVSLSRPIRMPRAAYLILADFAKIESREQVIYQLETTLEAMRQDGFMDQVYKKYIPGEDIDRTATLALIP